MAIKGLSDKRRSPRLGKVHLGVKAKSARTGAEYPQAVDYFVVKEDQSTLASAAKAFHTVYGEKPKALDIMFPTDNPEEFFPQFRRRYGSGSGLLCKGDGELAEQVNPETGEFEEIECNPDECEWNVKKHCRPVGSLTFLLPKVPGTGVWQLDTSSYHSIVNMNSAIDFVRGFTELATGKKKIGLIPLTLCVRPKEVQIEVNGKMTKKTVFILDLMNENLRFEDVMRNSLKSPLQMLVPDINLNEVPTDLYPASLIGNTAQEQDAEEEAKAEETVDTTTGEIVDATATDEQEEAGQPQVDPIVMEATIKAFDELRFPQAKRVATMKRFEGNPEGLIEYLQILLAKEKPAAAKTATPANEASKAAAKTPASEEVIDILAGEVEDDQPTKPKTIDEEIDELFAAIRESFNYDDEKIARLKKKFANDKNKLISGLKKNYELMKKRKAEKEEKIAMGIEEPAKTEEETTGAANEEAEEGGTEAPAKAEEQSWFF